MGQVLKLNLRYDRAGRSEGLAFVTYETRESALHAVKEFDGANANGTVPSFILLFPPPYLPLSSLASLPFSAARPLTDRRPTDPSVHPS